MASIHQLPHHLPLSCVQCDFRLDSSLVLSDHVLCSPVRHIIHPTPGLLQIFQRGIPEHLDVWIDLLQSLRRRFALGDAHRIFPASDGMRNIGVAHHHHRRVLPRKLRRFKVGDTAVDEYDHARLRRRAHELIHDAARAVAPRILRPLAPQGPFDDHGLLSGVAAAGTRRPDPPRRREGCIVPQEAFHEFGHRHLQARRRTQPRTQRHVPRNGQIEREAEAFGDIGDVLGDDSSDVVGPLRFRKFRHIRSGREGYYALLARGDDPAPTGDVGGGGRDEPPAAVAHGREAVCPVFKNTARKGWIKSMRVPSFSWEIAPSNFSKFRLMRRRTHGQAAPD
mmetsp:Transcript_51731/g.155244  ORF Transcript_51731/g.155244 Transcript_51731/m.155244 type:complete len:337 (+) Transcript_51731:315-1325(+)